MSLAAGTRLGPYEIVAPIGAGGMGEVYRAKDTRLDRMVAVKVLPSHLSADPEVRARFEREARAASSLNHPNICALYDVGHQDGVDYLVMELLEGETLAARLEKGALPTEPLLKIAIEIADALDKAHRQGLIHRDLKPANVMLTKSGAKLLDFGLARAIGLSPAVSDLTSSPTVARALTAEGTIVGTFQYMAPEQLEGKEADARSDLWAFGATLYEMATGKRAFEGKSQASLIAAILEREPVAISTLAPLSAPAVEQVVRACLAKDPDERVQTAHDVKLQLQWASKAGSQAGVPAPVSAARRAKSRLLVVVTTAACAIAAALAVTLWRDASVRPRVMRFELRIPTSLTPLGPLRIAPDGHAAAFAASDSGGIARIWVRTFEDLDCRALPGTEGTGRPFWSPDSRSLGFFAGGKLKKIQVAGGRAQTVCDAPNGADGCWGRGDVVLFDGDIQHNGIMMVSAAGGVPRSVVAPDTAKHEVQCAWPEMLPDGKHFLFTVSNAQADKAEIRIGDIGSKRTQTVTSGDGRSEYVSPGYLLFERDGSLLAQRMDVRTAKLSGEPHTVADQIGVNRANGMPYFSASQNGVLIYSQASSAMRRLVWMDRTGKQLEEIGTPAGYANIAMSPDGRHLAYELPDASGQVFDLWVRDLARGISSRLTTDPRSDIWPVWSRDGQRLYWASNRGGRYSIYQRRLEGLGDDSLFHRSALDVGPTDVSPDGAWLVSQETANGADWNIYVMPTTGDGKPTPIAATTFVETRPKVSPDGHWVAFDSDASGRAEVYVQAFPVPGPRVQISNQGGVNPLWRSDGKELYYRTLDQQLMAVDVTTGARFDAAVPHLLFTTPLTRGGLQISRYLPSSDGQRFLFSAPVKSEGAWTPITVFHWTEELRTK